MVEVTLVAANEALLGCSEQEAAERVRRALTAVGGVNQVTPEAHLIAGTIACGLQTVRVQVTLATESTGTRVVVQAKSDDVRQLGAQNATRRLLEALANLDNPDYVPDRRGMSRGSLAVRIIVVAVIISAIMAVLYGYLLRLR